MEEKVLFESKSKLKILGWILLAIAAFLLFLAFTIALFLDGDMFYVFDFVDAYYYWFFIFSFLLAVPGFYFVMTLGDIKITEKRVTRVSAFNRRIDIPVERITAIGKGMFRSVFVISPSAKLKVSFVLHRTRLLMFCRI